MRAENTIKTGDLEDDHNIAMVHLKTPAKR